MIGALRQSAAQSPPPNPAAKADQLRAHRRHAPPQQGGDGGRVQPLAANASITTRS